MGRVWLDLDLLKIVIPDGVTVSDLQLREKDSPKKLGFPELRTEKLDLIPKPQILGPFGPHENA